VVFLSTYNSSTMPVAQSLVFLNWSITNKRKQKSRS